MNVSRIVLLTVLWVLSLGLASASAESAASPRITELAVTTKIAKGNPIDSVRRISSTSVKALYCFTRLLGSEDTDTTIKHVWYRDNEKVGEYVLPVKGKRWRTYSKKSIQKGWSGDWRVEVLDNEGKLLKTVRFRMN